jgi:hypothetical protein
MGFGLLMEMETLPRTWNEDTRDTWTDNLYVIVSTLSPILYAILSKNKWKWHVPIAKLYDCELALYWELYILTNTYRIESVVKQDKL